MGPLQLRVVRQLWRASDRATISQRLRVRTDADYKPKSHIPTPGNTVRGVWLALCKEAETLQQPAPKVCSIWKVLDRLVDAGKVLRISSDGEPMTLEQIHAQQREARKAGEDVPGIHFVPNLTRNEFLAVELKDTLATLRAAVDPNKSAIVQVAQLLAIADGTPQAKRLLHLLEGYFPDDRLT